MFNFLTPQGIKFLTTSVINSQLEELLENAKEKIILVSPYIKLQKRIQEILTEKKSEGLDIFFVCRLQDLKEDISVCSTQIFDSPNLHAKCYMNEHEAIVTSLNLHEFSQQNNIEMGFHIKNCGRGKQAYSEILKEVGRLIKPKATKPIIKQIPAKPIEILPTPLELGKKYSDIELDKYFNFEYKGSAGIKKAFNGNLVLFSNASSKYSNREEDGIIYYYGADTGPGPQQLKFGNKHLYDCYGNKSAIIHFFKDYTYKGKVYVKLEPYVESNTGKWIFPLASSIGQ